LPLKAQPEPETLRVYAENQLVELVTPAFIAKGRKIDPIDPIPSLSPSI
jgi:hypothetical protein